MSRLNSDQDRQAAAETPGRGGRGGRFGGVASFWITVLAVALLACLAWGVSQYRARAAADLHLEMEHQRAFQQLVDRAENVEVLLAKGLVTSSGCTGSMVFTDLWHQGLGAQEDVGDLPLEHYSVSNTSKFMTQVADFAHYLVRKCAEGGELSDEDWSRLSELHTAAGNLSGQLQQLNAMMVATGFRWSRIGAAVATRLESSTQEVREGFGDLAEHMQDLPTLIYDGPFSDQVEARQPKGLGADEITAAQAMDVAKRFAPPLPGEAQTAYEATLAAEVPGKVAAYSVTLRPATAATPAPPGAAAPEVLIDVSKLGGKVIWFLVEGLEPGGVAGAGTGVAEGAQSAQLGTTQEDLIRAAEAARRFLDSRGFEDIVPTYCMGEAGTAICQFAAAQGGVVLYPDLLKVKVRLTDGQILGFEGLDYLMSHVARGDLKPRLKQAQAQSRLNPRLNVLGSRLALIPTPSLGEVLCYEFHVSLAGEPFLVYINANTGQEEAIFKILPADGGGQMVM